MATRRPIPTMVPSQGRLTRSLRARIETEAQSLLKAVRSAKKLSAKDKRALRGILAPLANATNSGSSAIRLSLSQLDSFRLGFGGAIRGFGGAGSANCLDDCERDAKDCTQDKDICSIQLALCVIGCAVSA